jgi:histidinol-phosphatase (PHP family)
MFDLHMHTTYCDGANSAEEMVLSAIDKGLDTVGISGHSYTWFDESYCMSKEGSEKYIAEVNALKEKYSDRIRVLLGIERELYAEISNEPFDYVIGSCHYISADGDFFDVDSALQDFMDGVNKHFEGDVMAAAEHYYEQVSGIIQATDCDIIGHFDLITKFNEKEPFLDIEDERYVSAWKKAVDSLFDDAAARYKEGRRNRLETLGLIEAGYKPVFEINTGAMAKGYRTSPYPSEDQIDYIKKRGGVLLLNSDSHRTDTICFAFDDYSSLL